MVPSNQSSWRLRLMNISRSNNFSCYYPLYEFGLLSTAIHGLICMLFSLWYHTEAGRLFLSKWPEAKIAAASEWSNCCRDTLQRASDQFTCSLCWHPSEFLHNPMSSCRRIQNCPTWSSFALWERSKLALGFDCLIKASLPPASIFECL